MCAPVHMCLIHWNQKWLICWTINCTQSKLIISQLSFIYIFFLFEQICLFLFVCLVILLPIKRQQWIDIHTIQVRRVCFSTLFWTILSAATSYIAVSHMKSNKKSSPPNPSKPIYNFTDGNNVILHGLLFANFLCFSTHHGEIFGRQSMI